MKLVKQQLHGLGRAEAVLVLLASAMALATLAEEAPDPALQSYYERQQQGAERGQPRDQYLLGVRYLKGDGLKQDTQLAINWIRTAVTNQNQEFPLSPTYRQEAEETLSRLEGRYLPPETTIKNPKLASAKGTTLTFTDRTGHKYRDLEVVIVEPNGIVYLEPDRIHAGKVMFATMPEPVRERFGYDPAEAAKFEQEQAQQASLAAQRALVEQQLQEARTGVQRPPDESHGAVRSVRTGTGFFVTDDGYILTCFHVVKGATTVGIKSGQTILPAQLMAADAANDIALLKVPGAFHALPFGASDSVKLGDTVITVGFPNVTIQGFEPKLTKGEISSLSGMRDDPRHFQISVAAQPGNSGGALADSNGNVVGLFTMRLSEVAALETSGALPQNVNYALKSDSLNIFLIGVPEVSTKLKTPRRDRDRMFDEVVKDVREASVLVIAGP